MAPPFPSEVPVQIVDPCTVQRRSLSHRPLRPVPWRWAAVGVLALAGARPGLPVRTYKLTMATHDLVELVRGQVFVDSGRFRPCRANPACSNWGSDIILTSPNITVDGPRLVFSVHLVGNYAMSQFFAATVTGDLIVSGVPVPRGNRVVLTQSAAAASATSDLAFRAFLEATHRRIETMLDQAPGFDLAQYLSYAASDPAIPPPRLPNVSCVDPSQIQLQTIATQPATSAVVAVVAVGPPPPGKCGA
jgi:hypothetical protein